MKLSEIPHKPADLGLVNSDGIFGDLIRPAQSLKYGSADATHAFMFLGSLFTPDSVVEQLWWMQTSPVTKYDGQLVKVWRNKLWSEQQKIQISTQMLSLANRPYPVLKLPLNLFDCVASKIMNKPVFWFTQTLGISSFTECAQAYAWAAYKVIGTDDIFGCPWRCIDPEGQDQWCEDHPSEWEQVFASS